MVISRGDAGKGGRRGFLREVFAHPTAPSALGRIELSHTVLHAMGDTGGVGCAPCPRACGSAPRVPECMVQGMKAAELSERNEHEETSEASSWETALATKNTEDPKTEREAKVHTGRGAPGSTTMPCATQSETRGAHPQALGTGNTSDRSLCVPYCM